MKPSKSPNLSQNKNNINAFKFKSLDKLAKSINYFLQL